MKSLLFDFLKILPDAEIFGIDISKYAIENSMKEVKQDLLVANACKLPFPNNSFDVVISINTIHNLDRNGCISALKEINRVAKGNKSFVQVDSFHTPEQKQIFESWVLTAYYHDYPENWIKLFEKAGYKGDYYWTII